MEKKPLKERAIEFYEHNEKRIDASIFFGGFFFDIFTLGRVDDVFNIVQQFVYLSILLLLIFLELRYEVQKVQVPVRLEKFWVYRRFFMHFLLGSLLSVYTLFFFKSSSIISSFVFILLIVTLMVLNEFPFIQNIGSKVRVVLWSLCFSSFLSIYVPTLFGFIGWIPFSFSMVASGAVTGFVFKRTSRYFTDKKLLVNEFLKPSITTYSVFLILYLLKFVPPVPLSLQYAGIYHKIEKQNGTYQLSYTRPSWKFWQNGDQTFLAQPGDKINIYIEIFAPGKFQDKIFLKWYHYEDKGGWTLQDTIPLSIFGGREGGFRGYSNKSNYTAGDWYIRVTTSDDREVGRIRFTIEPEEPTAERLYEVDVR